MVCCIFYYTVPVVGASVVGGVGVFKPGTFIGDFQSVKEKIIYVI